MNWIERQLERLREFNPYVVDGALAALFFILGVVSVLGTDVDGSPAKLSEGYRQPGALALVTALVICVPVVFRRRVPMTALVVSAAGIVLHIVANWPEATLPATVLFLTYSVGTHCEVRRAALGLGVVAVTLVALGLADSPGLDAVGVIGVFAQFVAVWAIGVALRSRRAATEARVREADKRAEAERQRTARVLAEERLRIAQELHDVVAHSMSVIAVQAGVGAHVLDERPEQARSALEAISATSRGTLTELRRLLGVLRDGDGARSQAPAPGLADLPRLVEDVRAVGVPATLRVEGASDQVHPGVELSAYRVVQEALTNVIKHAGPTTSVEVNVERRPGSLAVEVCDDGRGLAAQPAARGAGAGPAEGAGHGHVGMRERVELWGGELSVGPRPGGGYRVHALLPYGDAE